MEGGERRCVTCFPSFQSFKGPVPLNASLLMRPSERVPPQPDYPGPQFETFEGPVPPESSESLFLSLIPTTPGLSHQGTLVPL